MKPNKKKDKTYKTKDILELMGFNNSTNHNLAKIA